MLGQGVVDEFRTISGPILLSPSSAIGGIYDVGMLLADERDVDAPIDQGWPPLTIGIDTVPVDRSDSWQAELLDAMMTQESVGMPPWRNEMTAGKAGIFRVETFSCETDTGTVARLYACDAPMLPQQLQCLADIGDASITVAVATGNRLPRISDGFLHDVDAVSESQLAGIIQVAEQLPH